jgi:Conjugal transfer protein TrbL
MIWRTTLPAATALALVTSLVCVSSAHAQVQAPVGPLGPEQFFTDPARWVTSVFNGALIGLGRSTTDELVGFLDWLLGGGNIINQTPPRLSYDSEVVRRLSGTLRTVANSGLAVVAVWSGLQLIVQPHLRAPYHGALELLPRLLVGGVLVNTSLDWGRLAIDVNNRLCAALGTASMPGWSTVLGASSGGVLLNVIAIAIYLFMGLLLLAQMLMRLALVDALLIVAPIALLCWVLPQSQAWARLWFSTFFGTVFVQFLQVVVLQLGTELMQSLATLMPSAAANPTSGGREWLASLLLGVAVLQLARKVPRLMPGYPSAGGDGWGSLRALAARQVMSVLVGPRVGKG